MLDGLNVAFFLSLYNYSHVDHLGGSCDVQKLGLFYVRSHQNVWFGEEVIDIVESCLSLWVHCQSRDKTGLRKPDIP